MILPVPRALAGLAALAVLVSACGDDTDVAVPLSPPTTEDPGGNLSESTTTDAGPDDGADGATAATATAATPTLWPEDPRADDVVRRWTIEVVDRLDHDPTAFTQGLEVHDGVGYEGTGRRGQSTLRRFDPATGEELDRVTLDPDLFGEGLTLVGGAVVQLTLDEGTALRWDPVTLEPLAPFTYDGPGWGLCAADDSLVMTDGSAVVRRRDPVTFGVRAEVGVTLAGTPLPRLNELECVDGLVIANVWKEPRLVVFDPVAGPVLAEIDATAIIEEVAPDLAEPVEDVLNGVADLGDGTLLLTGKNWPLTFRVRLVAA